jgi:hypothetical protein
MAAGEMKLFEVLALNSFKKYHDFSVTDTFSVILTSNATGTIETTATPDRTDFTEVTQGGGYTTGGITLATPVWSETGGVATLDHNAGEASITWTSSASGDPIDIRTALLVNNNAAAVDDAIAIIDMTQDGTTAVSLLAGDVTITWGATGILTVTVNNP